MAWPGGGTPGAGAGTPPQLPSPPGTAAAAAALTPSVGGVLGLRWQAGSSTMEIGDLAVWSVTSAKPGNGVDLLRDNNSETFWQSDGLQPHLINIQFQRRVEVTELQVYLDYKLDESYTPNKIAVRAGNSHHDLKDVRVVELQEPIGWSSIPLGFELPGQQGQVPLKAFLLQVAVLSNHQNGRDSHVRGVQVYGRRPPALGGVLSTPLQPTSAEFETYVTIR